MTADDRAALREAAQRACEDGDRPREWELCEGWEQGVGDEGLYIREKTAARFGAELIYTPDTVMARKHAAFIALANPAAALELLADLDEWERVTKLNDDLTRASVTSLERVLGACGAHGSQCLPSLEQKAAAMKSERDAALARVAELEAERDAALDAAFEEHRRSVDRFLSSGASFALTDEVCPHGKAIGGAESCRICYWKAQRAERANPSPMRRRAFTLFARMQARMAELEAVVKAVARKNPMQMVEVDMAYGEPVPSYGCHYCRMPLDAHGRGPWDDDADCPAPGPEQSHAEDCLWLRARALAGAKEPTP